MEIRADFEQLTSSPELARFTRVLHELTGLGMAIYSADTTLSLAPPTRNKGSLCALIQSAPEGKRRCAACDRRHLARAACLGKAQAYACHAGLLDMAIPVIVESRHTVTIVSGQILPEPHSTAGLARVRRRLAWMHLPEARLRRAYDGAIYLPRRRVRSILRLLEIFARQLCESARRLREAEARHEHPAIRRAREYVDLHWLEPDLGLTQIASYAGLSAAHCAHLFRRVTGERLTHFVQRRRVLEAKRQMAQTDRTITEVAFACGFGSLTHFNRVFRGFELCSPSQWRKRQG